MCMNKNNKIYTRMRAYQRKKDNVCEGNSDLKERK